MSIEAIVKEFSAVAANPKGQLKAYKDEGYNFAYTYHSASRPQLVLYSLKVTAADYQ